LNVKLDAAINLNFLNMN